MLKNGDFVQIAKKDSNGNYIKGVVILNPQYPQDSTIVLNTGNQVYLTELDINLRHRTKPSLSVVAVYRAKTINDMTFNTFYRSAPPIFVGNGYVADTDNDDDDECSGCGDNCRVCSVGVGVGVVSTVATADVSKELADLVSKLAKLLA